MLIETIRSRCMQDAEGSRPDGGTSIQEENSAEIGVSWPHHIITPRDSPTNIELIFNRIKRFSLIIYHNLTPRFEFFDFIYIFIIIPNFVFFFIYFFRYF
jgi:hypothetical protein